MSRTPGAGQLPTEATPLPWPPVNVPVAPQPRHGIGQHMEASEAIQETEVSPGSYPARGLSVTNSLYSDFVSHVASVAPGDRPRTLVLPDAF